jgi:protein-tyrosine phosphatase
MRQIPPYSLWLGHAGDGRNVRAVLDAGILAVVDLALEEAPARFPREIAYFRIPLIDGAGNPPWLLRAGVEIVAMLLRSNTPTLIFCGAGMSRSPTIAAAAISTVSGRPAAECLEMIAKAHACDVSPALWREIAEMLS